MFMSLLYNIEKINKILYSSINVHCTLMYTVYFHSV